MKAAGSLTSVTTTEKEPLRGAAASLPSCDIFMSPDIVAANTRTALSSEAIRRIEAFVLCTLHELVSAPPPPRASRLRTVRLQLLVLHLLHTNLHRGVVSTQRDVYYHLATLVPDQGTVNRTIQQLVRLLGAPRQWLGVIPGTRGCVGGCVDFGRVDLRRHGSEGLALPATHDELRVHKAPATTATEKYRERDTERERDENACCFTIHAEVRFILVVEKHAVFYRLMEERVYERVPCVLLTSHGFPTAAARTLLTNFHQAVPHVPVVALVDYNPSGLHILWQYRHGAGNICEGRYAAVHTLRWLGLRRCHIAATDGTEGIDPRVPCQRFSQRDAVMLDNLLSRWDEAWPVAKSSTGSTGTRSHGGEERALCSAAWREEAQWMARVRAKVELEALVERATTGPSHTRIEDRLRCRFLGVVSQLLPPCGSSAAPTPSPQSPATATFIEQQQQRQQQPQQVEWGVCSDSHTVALLLATELGLGGRLFVICMETFQEFPGRLRPSVAPLLEETLYAGMMNYSCGGTHDEGIQNPELSLAELADRTPTAAGALAYNDSGSSSTSVCPNTSIFREAAALVAFHESWCLRDATLADPTDESRVEDLCAYAVASALKVANAAGAVAVPRTRRRMRSDNDNDNDNNGNAPARIMHGNDHRPMNRRGDEDVGTCTPVTWLRVTDPLAAPELHTRGISSALRSPPSLNSEAHGPNVEAEDPICELGFVLSVLSEACDSRTSVDSTAWQYGRNRISLASTTVITRHGGPARGGEAHKKRNRTHRSNDKEPVTAGDESELLGFFLHETGTLYTKRGERLLMEVP